jgi:ATP-dependent DNA ligase
MRMLHWQPLATVMLPVLVLLLVAALLLLPLALLLCFIYSAATDATATATATAAITTDASAITSAVTTAIATVAQTFLPQANSANGGFYPDKWIHPKDSVVLEIKSAELCSSHGTSAGLQMRFPRTVRVSCHASLLHATVSSSSCSGCTCV